jgi:hypothetical protein
MKIKLPILLLFVFFCNENLYAQDTIFKKYNRNTDFPRFWIVGVDLNGFPSLKSNGSASDSLRYGERILKWIEINAALYNSIAEAPADYLNISYVDFQKFSSDQKNIFKELSLKFEPILIFQKNKIKQYENSQNGIKKTKDAPKAQQVYLLNKVELLNWKTRLGI